MKFSVDDQIPITDDQLIHLGQLLDEQQIDIRKDALVNHTDDTNINFKYLQKCITEQQFNLRGELINNSVAGAILEGSSRSGKTWAGVDIIIWLCTKVETSCKINIYRETFAEFKDSLYEDFRKRLDHFGLPNKFHGAEIVKSFRIGNNIISFKGCDKLSKAHGSGTDYVFFNEIMHIKEGIFKHAAMRCKKFWWADYNPSFTDHWVFNKLITRKDVGYLHSTWKDNKFISYNERNEIIITEPWKPGSYKVTTEGCFYKGKLIDDDNQPPAHSVNEAAGTIDQYYWNVYGLGLRGSMEGVIFKQITWIPEWPKDLAYTWANDFGFTVDPNVLGKYSEDENNIWIEVRSYEPIETVDELEDRLLVEGVQKDELITCDSSDKHSSQDIRKGTVEMVKGLKRRGWKAKKVRKTKSVMYWLLSMKKKKIHFVRNQYWKAIKIEREQYKMREIQGILINQPIDKYNHIWDMARYGHIDWNLHSKTHQTKKSVRRLGVNY